MLQVCRTFSQAAQIFAVGVDADVLCLSSTAALSPQSLLSVVALHQ